MVFILQLLAGILGYGVLAIFVLIDIFIGLWIIRGIIRLFTGWKKK